MEVLLSLILEQLFLLLATKRQHLALPSFTKMLVIYCRNGVKWGYLLTDTFYQVFGLCVYLNPYTAWVPNIFEQGMNSWCSNSVTSDQS